MSDLDISVTLYTLTPNANPNKLAGCLSPNHHNRDLKVKVSLKHVLVQHCTFETKSLLSCIFFIHNN